MSKKRKSKFLAMALCAAVMSGIYASPVLAGTQNGLSITGTTITAEDTVTINGVTMKNGTLTATGLTAEGASGGMYLFDIGSKTMIMFGPKGEDPAKMYIDPDTGNLFTKGTVGVGGSRSKPITQINANGDIAIGVEYDEANAVTGQKIHLSAESGSITAADFNGVKITGNSNNAYINGVEIGAISTNVGGITRTGSGDPGAEGAATTIENALSVSVSRINMFGDTEGLTFAKGTWNYNNADVSGADITGNMHVGASNFYYTYNENTYTLSDLVDTVADIYDRTQGISYADGTTTVDGNLAVTDGASTGAGGNADVEGSLGVGGDATVDGVLNAGSGTIGDVTMSDGNINTNGVVNAAGGTIGDVTMSDGNINTDGVVNAAKGGTIGGVAMSDGNINTAGVVNAAAGGTIGDVTMSNGTITTGDTTVDGSGVSIADSTIISGHDVVINSGDADEVSLADVGSRVGSLEQGLGDLNSRVNNLEDRINKVGAMSAAIANLRTMGYDPAAPTEVAVGVGQYRDETGAALGLFHYPNRDFMLSLSVSTAGDEVMGGIGATWKFGRKSPEKVAAIKQAQAEADVRRAEAAKLAKAEALKEAAHEAKVRAQMERHAKMAAEQAAE